MNLVSLGKIASVTPGTPVPLSADLTIKVHKIIFVQVPGGTGATYVGLLSMNKTTLAGCLRVVKKSASGDSLTDQYTIGCADANPLRLADYAIDADTAADGLLVSYVLA